MQHESTRATRWAPLLAAADHVDGAWTRASGSGRSGLRRNPSQRDDRRRFRGPAISRGRGDIRSSDWRGRPTPTEAGDARARCDRARRRARFHQSSQPSLAEPALPRAENMLTQGVTTEILILDGGGPLDIRTQLSDLQSGGLAVNVGAYIGFNSAWNSVVGPSDRRPTPEELERMRGLISAALEAGAWGVSAGLDYKPAYFAKTEEVIDVVSAAKAVADEFHQPRPAHSRTEFQLPAKAWPRRCGLRKPPGSWALVTHMKVQGHEQGSAGVTLAGMQRAAARGHYVAADVYPYLAGQTALGALLVPAWAQDGGRPEMLKRLADPEQRTKIAA